MGLIKEFRDFAMKGNVVDMAVGIIIGGAFGGIVQSFIKDVVMPVIGIFGKADFTNLYLGLTEGVRAGVAAFAEANGGAVMPLEQARGLGPVLAWGNFITILMNFVILAFAIFMMIKVMNEARRRFEKQEAEAPKAPPAPPEDLVVLKEIRDLMKSRS